MAPTAVETALLGWVRVLRTHGRDALHLGSAWATTKGVVLGQVATDADSIEITAIPSLLDALAFDGVTVTIYALSCRTAISKRIVAGGG